MHNTFWKTEWEPLWGGSAAVYGVFVDLLTLWFDGFNLLERGTNFMTVCCPPVSGAWVWRYFYTLLWDLNLVSAWEQRLQQGAYVLCALHSKIPPPLNNVDIPSPRAISIRDGSQANDCPPSFPTEESHLPPSAQGAVLHLGEAEWPWAVAALKTLLFGGVLGKVLKQNDIYIVRNNIIKAIKVHYFTHPHNLSILLYLICDKIVEKGYLM